MGYSTWAASRWTTTTCKGRWWSESRCRWECSSKARAGTSNARRGARQANWQTTSCLSCNTRSSRQSRSSRGAGGSCCSKAGGGIGGRGSIDRQRNDLCATDDAEAESATFFSLGDGLCCAWRSFASAARATELFSIGENEVHVLHYISFIKVVTCCDTDLVEGHQLPNHLPTILKCYLHAVVDLRAVSEMWVWAGIGALTRFCYITRRQSVSMRVVLRSKTRAARQVYIPFFPDGLQRQTC
jgi:hypothetical protein